MNKFLLPGLAFCAACATMALQPAQAQNTLFQGPHGTVTAAEVTADATTRIPERVRGTVLARPDNVGQLASNLYVQRAMAAEAERTGLAQGEVAAASLVLAREKALADLYLARLDQRNQPTDAALDAYAQTSYRAIDDQALQAPARTRASHILVKGDSPAARAKIDKLLTELKAGADFAHLARLNSDDPASASKGGDLGFQPDGGMVPSFELALKELKTPGELSPVVKSSYGFHIIRLEERRPEGKRGFDEVRDQLREQARATLLREARAKDAQALLEGANPEQPAIDAFANQYAKQTD